MTDADRFDVFLCSAPAADAIEKALRTGGLRVFRDTGIDDFDMVKKALAGSRVLVLPDSPESTARTTQALTAAFAAALRHGDPAGRVLRTGREPLPDVVRQVRRAVAATDGPLGASVLWTVHSALAARRVVLLRGLPGIGKTTLAEQYARVFREAVGGAVLRTGPFGHVEPDDFLPRFHLALATAAGETSGPGFDGLRTGLAARIDAAGGEVLLLVDDVPAGLPPGVLDRVLLPSGAVRTLLTSRFAQSHWTAATIDVPGLTLPEGLRLLPADAPAARRFVTRCEGHPMTLRATATSLRKRPGTGPAALPDTAPQAIRDALHELGELSRDVLRLGATLAPAPIPPEVARAALGDPEGAEFEAALEELVAEGFATRVDGNLRLQALAVEVAGGEFGELPGKAAEAILDGLTTPCSERRHLLLQHARTIADHSPSHRVALLRPVAAAHEAHGDPVTAGEVHAVILATGQATSADLAAAARVEIACGLDSEAAGHAREALALAADDDERRVAGLVAARALDGRGDYAEADRIFWHDHAPDSDEQRYHAAVARRLRGRPQEAIALLGPALAAPGPLRDALALEYARNLLQAGQPQKARDAVAELAGAEAELLRADATLALEPAGREPAELSALAETFARRHGAENPLALTAGVHAGRALLALGQPRQALAALSATEEVVLRVLGDGHRLHHRIRHGMGLAHARLRDFGRQADLLEGILPPQIRLLGLTHPETLESRLDLGLALALSGRGPLDRATALVDDAAADIRAARTTGLSAKARAAQQVVRLPPPFVSALHTLERLIWPGG
ncbi:hypothetical protein [Amycolatopsis sp. cmx-4-68]|uniref:hypothetical protein n=1 Tax=Amycolatopsis sp. cmx-4-68 TaxID=2790938 RepID=UPI00397D8AC3